MVIKQVPAHPNNYAVGRNGNKISYIVMHWIVGTLEAADATFQNPNRIASSTYGVGDTEVHQYVKESDTSYANSNLDSNRKSITIEHEGGWDIGNGQRFKPTEETLKTSAALVADICKRYNIPIDAEHILPHNKFSATQCPGTLDINRIIQLAKGVEETMVITKKQFEDLITKLDKQEKEIEALKKANQELKAQLEASGNAKKDLEKQITELDKEVQDLETLNASTKEENKALKAEVKTLEKDLSVCEHKPTKVPAHSEHQVFGLKIWILS